MARLPCGSVTRCPCFSKITLKFGKGALVTHQYGHYIQLSDNLLTYPSYFRASRNVLALLYSSLICTEWVREGDVYMSLLCFRTSLRHLGEFPANRRHLLGLQAIPLASNRKHTLWHKQNPSWWVKKKLENHWRRFLWSTMSILSSDKFHGPSLDFKSSALDIVNPRSLTRSLSSFWLR